MTGPSNLQVAMLKDVRGRLEHVMKPFTILKNMAKDG